MKSAPTTATSPAVTGITRFLPMSDSLMASTICGTSVLLVYLFTLAPTVTFEDSGELISAAYHMGVPHQPGYPLFTLLAHLFTLLPVGTIAYRVNLMSAVFSTLGASLTAGALYVLLGHLFTDARDKSLRWAGICSAVAGGCLAAWGFEAWEQSIITEVYGLHGFFVGLLLWISVEWIRQPQQRDRFFALGCFALGLGLSNHPTTLLLIPAFAALTFLYDERWLFNLRRLAAGAAMMSTGLLPYLYLPLASLRNPLMDWGNPENLTNFVRTVTRHQYQLGEPRTWMRFSAQLQVFGDQLISQWWVPWLFVALIGLFILFRRDKNFFWFSIVILLLTTSVTAYAINFDILHPNPEVGALNAFLSTVFFIPAYQFTAVLAGIGMFSLARLLRGRRWVVVWFVLAAAALGKTALTNRHKLDMHEYRFAEHYVRNLFSVVDSGAVVFTNVDMFTFPLFYYQQVEGLRPDLLVIDQELLRRSWYLQTLRDHYPVYTASVGREIDEFLEAVRPFEEGRTYDAGRITSRFNVMVNAMIDRPHSSGRSVYLTYDPAPAIAKDYFKEPVFAAIKLAKPFRSFSEIDDQQLLLEDYSDPAIPKDRWARFFQTYYGRLFFARAYLKELNHETNEARRLYTRARDFFDTGSEHVSMIEKALQRVAKADPDTSE